MFVTSSHIGNTMAVRVSDAVECFGDVVWIVAVTSLWILNFAGANEEVYQAGCRDQLGMYSGSIEDHMITASSSYDHASVGPQNARIRTEQKGGAWCPGQQITSETYEWLEVDMGEYRAVTLVETQGRFGNGQGQEYAEQYIIEYQRQEGTPWVRYHNRYDQHIFEGNTNTYIAELREVNPPIIARRLRLIPYSSHPRTICMRIELYGCSWNDGILSYSMRQGDRRGAEVDLYDFSYDGAVTDNLLTGGIGQLIDGEIGPDNFRLDPTGTGKKGYEWVGWKNETINANPVEINYYFDVIRNFTSLKIHVNNMFLKDVRVFKRVEIWFSVGGRYYQAEPRIFHFMRDELMEFSRHVIIPVSHRLAQFVKLRLYFDARWMIVSETKFISEPARRGAKFPEEDTSPSFPSSTDFLKPPPSSHTTKIRPVDSHTNLSYIPLDSVPQYKEEKASLEEDHIGIIIGVMAAFILIVFVIAVVIIYRHRQRKNGSNSHIKQAYDAGHVTLNLHDLQLSDGGPVCNGKLNNGNVYNSLAQCELFDRGSNGTLRKNGTVNGTVNGAMNGGMNGTLNGEPLYPRFDVMQTRRLPDLPKTPESTETNTSWEYAVPDIMKSAVIANGGNNSFKPNIYGPEDLAQGVSPQGGPPPPPPPPHPSALYGGGSDVLTYPNLQGVSGNNVYSVPNHDLLWKEDLSVMEFPRENLQFREKIGEGQFGEVHLCEAMQVTDQIGDDFLVNRMGSQSLLVAVKTLRPDADQAARENYHKEIQIMSKLKDPNIVRVLGVIMCSEPYCVVVEYMKFGDLNEYLHQHCPSSTAHNTQHTDIVLSYGSLIYMATQIASGMKYLESLNMVHRDLATRNCLVGSHFTIKISDFGMSRSIYSGDYYRIEGKAVLPIRWMAWESVLLGKFSSKSDVWSFAVTLWEILTFAVTQPLIELNDEAVIDNCGHYYRNDLQHTELSKPDICPKEIYDLMCECWNREDSQRPAFREIHLFLQRKNMGYNPRDDIQSNYQDKQDHSTLPIV